MPLCAAASVAGRASSARHGRAQRMARRRSTNGRAGAATHGRRLGTAGRSATSAGCGTRTGARRRRRRRRHADAVLTPSANRNARLSHGKGVPNARVCNKWNCPVLEHEGGTVCLFGSTGRWSRGACGREAREARECWQGGGRRGNVFDTVAIGNIHPNVAADHRALPSGGQPLSHDVLDDPISGPPAQDIKGREGVRWPNGSLGAPGGATWSWGGRGRARAA